MQDDVAFIPNDASFDKGMRCSFYCFVIYISSVVFLNSCAYFNGVIVELILIYNIDIWVPFYEFGQDRLTQYLIWTLWSSMAFYIHNKLFII